MWIVGLLLLAIGFIVVATAKLKLHPFFALILAALGFGLMAGMPAAEVVSAIKAGFGGTVGGIGIVIVAGTVIGVFLERSGGASRLAESALRLAGERNVPAAMGGVGFVVSLPVFCDSGFVLLAPLNRALAKRSGSSLAAGAIALSLGLYATHTMVPPTPGPVAAAGILGADLGRVILWGLPVAFAALVAGWLFAVTVAAKVELRPEANEDESSVFDDEAPVPSLALSVAPLLVPIALIVGASVSDFPGHPLGEGALVSFLAFFGSPVIALLVGVGLACALPRPGTRGGEAHAQTRAQWVSSGILAAAPILVITGAGGAFGKVLQGSGIADVVGSTLATWSLGLFLPFLIAAGIKTAQGSSTVAIITTAGLLAPLVESLGLGGETGRALTVVAIGAGSMVVSHANDSYFWVVTQFSNMDLRTGFKLQTVGTLVEGSTAAVAVWLVGLVML